MYNLNQISVKTVNMLYNKLVTRDFKSRNT